MKLPRDMDATKLIEVLSRLGYKPVQKEASHMPLISDDPVHAITIPNNRTLSIGTLRFRHR